MIIQDITQCCEEKPVIHCQNNATIELITKVTRLKGRNRRRQLLNRLREEEEATTCIIEEVDHNGETNTSYMSESTDPSALTLLPHEQTDFISFNVHGDMWENYHIMASTAQIVLENLSDKQESCSNTNTNNNNTERVKRKAMRRKLEKFVHQYQSQQRKQNKNQIVPLFDVEYSFSISVDRLMRLFGKFDLGD